MINIAYFVLIASVLAAIVSSIIIYIVFYKKT